jgi:hypothetical protein
MTKAKKQRLLQVCPRMEAAKNRSVPVYCRSPLECYPSVCECLCVSAQFVGEKAGASRYLRAPIFYHLSVFFGFSINAVVSYKAMLKQVMTEIEK